MRTTNVSDTIAVEKPMPMFGSMLFSHQAGDDCENAQDAKYVTMAKAGKNMIRRRPELIIWRSMAWTIASGKRKANLEEGGSSSVESMGWVSRSWASMVTHSRLHSKAFTPLLIELHEYIRSPWVVNNQFMLLIQQKWITLASHRWTNAQPSLIQLLWDW